MKPSKFDDPALRQKAVDTIVGAGKPVSVRVIADALDISWVTAKVLLLSLSLAGEIVAVESTSGFLFLPPRTQPGQRLRKKRKAGYE